MLLAVGAAQTIRFGFVGADDGPKGPGPALGQHTREILASVGYSPAEVETLYAAKAVA